MELESSFTQTSNRMSVPCHQQVCSFPGGLKAHRVVVTDPDEYERLTKFNLEAGELPATAKLGADALWK